MSRLLTISRLLKPAARAIMATGLSAALVLSVASCNNNDDTGISPMNKNNLTTFQDFVGIRGVSINEGRLVFDNSTTFIAFITKLESDVEFQKNFLASKTIKSLESVIQNPENQKYQELLPWNYRQILNSNAEVIIGENLIWYSVENSVKL